MAIKFQSLTGQPLIEIPDSQFELSIETPDGIKNITLEDLMAFINSTLDQRVATVEQTLEGMGVDPNVNRTLTVSGDVEGSADMMTNNVILTLNVPDGALSTSAVAGLAASLLGLRLDVDDALTALSVKLDADAPAIAAHKLETARQINGVLFDGTQDITIGLSAEQQEALGTDKFYDHDQSTPSALWVVNHSLNKRPSVAVVDSAGTSVTGGVEYIDANTLHISFAGAMAGRAFIN